MSSIDSKISKREEEQLKIIQLREKLNALKNDNSKERNLREITDFHKKCENLLSLTKRICENIEESIITDKHELITFKTEYIDKYNKSSNVNKLLRKQIKILEQKNEMLQEESNLGDKVTENALSWKEKYEKELEKNIKYEKELNEANKNENSNVTISNENNSTNDKLTLISLQLQNEKLLSKIKHLQTTFENEEALARALYGNLGVDLIPNPSRCGFLTKQGGAVKSWKRRYFVLKDNFLFYYKRQKDDTPTGVIQLEGCQAEEFASSEDEKRNCFKIITENRVWLLQADRQIEMDIWIDCIRNAEPWWSKEATSDSLTGRDGTRRDVIRKKKGSFRISTYLGSNQNTKKT